MMVPYTHSKNMNGYGNITYQQKESRMQEIVNSIQNTLNYPYTGFIFIFYQDPLLIPYMVQQNLNHSQRMLFVSNMADTISTLFQFANNNLQNRTVMILNADTYPMEGFEKVNSANLRNKLVYLISRYVIWLKIKCLLTFSFLNWGSTNQSF